MPLPSRMTIKATLPDERRWVTQPRTRTICPAVRLSSAIRAYGGVIGGFWYRTRRVRGKLECTYRSVNTRMTLRTRLGIGDRFDHDHSARCRSFSLCDRSRACTTRRGAARPRVCRHRCILGTLPRDDRRRQARRGRAARLHDTASSRRACRQQISPRSSSTGDSLDALCRATRGRPAERDHGASRGDRRRVRSAVASATRTRLTRFPRSGPSRTHRRSTAASPRRSRDCATRRAIKVEQTATRRSMRNGQRPAHSPSRFCLRR